MNNTVNLPKITITPTMRCNLKCRLCGVLVPHYDYRPHMTFAEFADTLRAVFSIVDNVEQLQITGGEPMLHADLPLMIQECFRYGKQFGNLRLFVNCATLMKSQLLDTLIEYRDRIIVHASDYGANPENSRNLVKAIEDNGIELRYLKYHGEDQYFDGWVDNGDFVCHNRSKFELMEVFSKCSQIDCGGLWYVRGGQMHWCGRSIRGTELDKIPLRQEDYLDIFNENVTLNEKREKLKRLMKAEYILACDYCNGYYGTDDKSKRYPAGEQMKLC